MNTSETFSTTFDNMCDIILEAGSQDGVMWEQSESFEIAVDVVYRYINKDDSEDDDLSVIPAVFGDMLEVMGLEDTGFDSYSQMVEAMG
jgi:hypothetical protein